MPVLIKSILSINYFYWLLVSMVFYAGGEFWSKKFALHPKLSSILLLLFFYALGALAWIVALWGKDELSDVGAMWAVLSLMTTVAIGFYIFKERLNPYGIAGIILSAIAIFLLSKS